MAQASPSWQQLVNQMSNWALLVSKTGATKQRNLQRLQGPGGILSFLTVVVAMLLWNWKLLLAGSIGIGTMVSAYSMQKRDLSNYWLKLSHFFDTHNRRLLIAVLSGSIATLTSYTAIAVFLSSKNPWIATGALVQGTGTLLTLILLVWLITTINENKEQNQIDQLLVNLTQPDPLKRLITLRQLTKLVSRSGVDVSERQTVINCLQLLLTQEEETLVRDAAFDSLQTIERFTISEGSTTPLKPLGIKVKQKVY
ncbi:MAG: armadillo-type fold-containing protein [Calothrix sp. C42_A2020_038]|nr:armadillo-type fold-containing protein [Calothrix sp. C42_A2020_038]